MDVQCIIHGRNSYIDRSYFMQSVIIKTTWKEKYVLDRVYRMSDRTIRIHGQARGICFAPLNSVIFGMLGDVVEFGQWKTHLRQESFIFAIGSVGTKLGNGITAAVLTQLLAFSGYVSKAGVTTQPQSVVNMIMNIYKVGPLIVWVTVVIILLLYRLDKKYPMIMKELEEREARGEL